jgi:D-glycerate 3-kinase
LDDGLQKALIKAAHGDPPDASLLAELERWLLADPLQRAIVAAHVSSASEIVRYRLAMLKKVWPAFIRDWNAATAAPPDIDTLWRLYLPFVEWLIAQKRAKKGSAGNPNALFLLGIYGSQGRGKTFMARRLVTLLNALLEPHEDGQAISLSIDDFYLGAAARTALKPLGYDPGAKGVSNRGPAGTHDTAWLLRALDAFKRSTDTSQTPVGAYSKSDEGQMPEYEGASKDIVGKVGIVLLDGWFVGAETSFELTAIPPNRLAHAVGQALQSDYKEIFDQLDALWAFDTPDLETIQRNREEQERQQEKEKGARQMSTSQIKAFVEYFYRKSWQPGVTSPVPPLKNVTFLARLSEDRQIVAIEPGGRQKPR